MTNKKLNCAVVGLGIGEQHARALMSHPCVRLAGVCDIDDTKTKDFLTKYNLDFTLGMHFSDILQNNNIDVVSIASFDDHHFEQVISCLEHRKHVFVEKPLCQSQEQLKKIYNTWKNSGLALSSNLILRKAPLYIWLKEIIQTGRLGEIYAMDMDYLYGRIHKITEGWRSKIKDYSVMAGGGIHLIDLMIQLLNQNPIKVQSSVNQIATFGTQFRYPDFHAATFYFDNGVIGRVTANFGCMHKHQHVVRIFGTNATFIYDDMGSRIHWKREEDADPEIIKLAPKPIDKGSLLLEFIDKILQNNYKEKTEMEFNLMDAVIAADLAIQKNNSLIDIQYLIH